MSQQSIHKDISILIRDCAQHTTLTLFRFPCDTPTQQSCRSLWFFFHLSCSYQNLPCWHWSMSVATWKMESSTEVLTARIDFYRKPVSPIAQWLAVVDCQNKWLHLDPFLIFPHRPFFLSLWWTVICSNLVQWFHIINGGIHYNHQQSSISHVVLRNKNLFATVK